MAKYTVKTKKVRKTIEVEEKDGVILELSKDEAQTLADILCCVGGASLWHRDINNGRVRSRRFYADEISFALRDAGFMWSRETQKDVKGGSEIQFLDLPVENN